MPPAIADADRRNELLNTLKMRMPAAPLPAAVGSANPFAPLASAPETVTTPASVAANPTSLRVATWSCNGYCGTKDVELHDAAVKLNLDVIAI